MRIWTEILSEDVAAVHFECEDYRYLPVAVPLNGRFKPTEISDELAYLEERTILMDQRRQRRAMQKNIEKRQESRERLEEAGYSEDQIPL